MGATYIIITKIPMRRLRDVIHQLIFEKQEVFFHEGQITDGILVANELIVDQHMNGDIWTVHKVGLKKAYMSFECLNYTLSKMAFCVKRSSWVIKCVPTAFSVLVIGSPADFFKSLQKLWRH